jgi:hypothetical protein
MVFLPGQSGNPSGRPSGKPITQALVSCLNLPSGSSDNILLPSDAKISHEIAAKLIDQARQGNSAAIQEIINRVEGKPIQQLDIKKIDPFEELTLDDILRLRDALSIRIADVSGQDRGTVIEAEARIISTLPETETIPQPGQDET